MIYCDNLACDSPDEPIERISDYRILDGAVICVGCAELDEDEDEDELDEAEYQTESTEGFELDGYGAH